MKVKLAPGRALRDPQTHTLMMPGDVRDVPDNSMYWRRRLRDGDVVAVEEPEPKPRARPPVGQSHTQSLASHHDAHADARRED
jgi:Protein of unknown function (DUF2635)